MRFLTLYLYSVWKKYRFFKNEVSPQQAVEEHLLFKYNGVVIYGQGS